LYKTFQDPTYNPEGYELLGSLAYRAFDSAVVLTELMRVEHGEKENEFKELLARVRRGETQHLSP